LAVLAQDVGQQKTVGAHDAPRLSKRITTEAQVIK